MIVEACHIIDNVMILTAAHGGNIIELFSYLLSFVAVHVTTTITRGVILFLAYLDKFIPVLENIVFLTAKVIGRIHILAKCSMPLIWHLEQAFDIYLSKLLIILGTFCGQKKILTSMITFHSFQPLASMTKELVCVTAAIHSFSFVFVKHCCFLNCS